MMKRIAKAILYSLSGVVCFLFVTFMYVEFTRVEASDFPDLKSGDLVFQTTDGAQTSAIMLATFSPYTHMGMIKVVSNGAYKVVEAIGPVREVSLDQWIQQGIGGRITVGRLKDLNEVQAEKALSNAKKYYGRGYDRWFLFGNEEIYCSELVYIILKEAGYEVGEIKRLKDLNIGTSAATKLIQRRWKTHPLCKKKGISSFDQCSEAILDQELITPASLASDSNLEIIYSNYSFLK